jgi:hypothetical protein
MACKEWDQVAKSPIDGWRTIKSQEICVFVKWQGKEWNGMERRGFKESGVRL